MHVVAIFSQDVIGMFAALVADHGQAEEPGPVAVPLVAEGPAAAVAIPAEAVEVGRALARGRRGRDRGYKHSEHTKTKITAGLLKARLQSSKLEVAGGIQSAAQSQVESVFHAQLGNARRQTFSFVPVQGGPVMSIPIDTRSAYAADRLRVIASHLEAQAKGIRDFLGDCCSRGTNFVLYTNTFDDASMWVSSPPVSGIGGCERAVIQAAAHADPAVAGKLAKRAKKGRMQHCPVLNMCETVFTLKGEPRNSVQALSPHSPAIVMPCANYSTVLHHWSSWTVCNGFGTSGSKLDSGGIIQAASPSSWACMAMVKDGLMVNGNIVCHVEKRLKIRREEALGRGEAAAADSVPSIYSTNCAAHSIVLCTKPVIHSLCKPLSSFVVRMGHLCQSSRAFCKIRQAVDAVVKASFHFPDH